MAAELSAFAPFELPKKSTCTPGEAAAAWGVSERQVRNLIETGELLAISSNLNPETTQRPQWRVVVKLQRQRPDGRHAMTLEEVIAGRMSHQLDFGWKKGK